MRKIPIGTLVKGSEDPASAIKTLAPAGFECFSIMFWQTYGGIDLAKLRDDVLEATGTTATSISSLAVYGNALDDSPTGLRTREDLASLIELAPSLEAPVVGCFAGRVPGASVPDSMDKWNRVFSPMVERAEALGVKIAFENCRLGDTWKRGKWNIAFNPDAWDLMFRTIDSQNIGLEWEPCHQLEMLCDPIGQLSEWALRIFHVHGKDSRIDHDLIRTKGLHGAESYHESCLPGFGDTNWKAIFTILQQSGYQGTVDIEGWNDTRYSGDLEITGQKAALDYLLRMRDES